MPYLSASAMVIHYEEALYQVYAPLPPPLIALYGLESWALKNNDEKLIAAFEMWVRRRTLGISRTERKN